MKLKAATIHRVFNSLVIIIVAVAVVQHLGETQRMLEYNHTLPECEKLLYEVLYEKENPYADDVNDSETTMRRQRSPEADHLP